MCKIDYLKKRDALCQVITEPLISTYSPWPIVHVFFFFKIGQNTLPTHEDMWKTCKVHTERPCQARESNPELPVRLEC